MLFGFLGYSIACQPCSRPSIFFTTFVLHSFALLESYFVNDSLLLHCLCRIMRPLLHAICCKLYLLFLYLLDLGILWPVQMNGRCRADILFYN